MARETRMRPREPYRPKPVEKVELSEKHVKLRVVLVILLALLGASGIALGVFFLLNTGAGWQEIEVTSGELHCGEEFTFLYSLGNGELSPADEKRAVSALYSNACGEAYRLFVSGEEAEDAGNLASLNARPNQEVELKPEIYRALEEVASSEERSLYMAPAYSRYNNIFDCIDDSQTFDFDPLKNPEVAEEFAQAATFASDPAAVNIELLGNDRARLKVSPEYEEWFEENEDGPYVDWGFLRNAFIADYLAEVLIDGGFTHGSISSWDGFVRNLDGSGEGYSLSLYDRAEGGVYPAARMDYTGPASLVYLRDYPLTQSDQVRFYVYQNGEIRPPYLDPADGLCKSAGKDLVCLSQDLSCAQVALRAAPLYIADELREEKVSALREEGVFSVYCQNSKVICNDPKVTFSNLYRDETLQYTVERP